MKTILFSITTFSGLGGHYYSLVTTAKALSEKYNVYIINIGKKISPVIENSGLPYSFVYSNNRNIISVTSSIINLIIKIKPEVIHAFDNIAYIHSFFSALLCRKPLVLTKCGGPINKIYPFSNNLIVYTREDYEHFRRLLNEKESQVAFIPNRVIPFSQDYTRIEELRNRFCLSDRRVILRIGRIDSFYYQTIKQCINLVKDLHDLDPSFVLLIIGNIVNNETFEVVQKEVVGCDYIKIVTEKKYTLDAKELIDIAEVVVGTGRGFMEASSIGKKMMAPNNRMAYPVYVTPDNFNDIFYYNFSERYSEGFPVSKEDILNRINNDNSNSYQWYEEFFSASMIEPRYTAFYEALKPTAYRKIFKTIKRKMLSLWYHSFD